MDVCGAVMQNLILVEKIANALTYTSLKKCRSLNSLWYEEVTKVLKKKSVILVSRDTIPQIMSNDSNSTDIFCKAVRINTSFSLGDTPWILNFFRAYAESLEFIEWTDSAEIRHLPNQEENGISHERQSSVMHDWNYTLPKLTELVLKPTFTFGNNLTLILKSAPNLRILRLDCIANKNSCMNEFLAALQAQTDLSHLKTLQFGENTFWEEANVQVLMALPNLELEEFIMQGRMLGTPRSSRIFTVILERCRWSDTLETVVFPSALPFELTKTMPRLKKMTAGRVILHRTLPLNIQFPSLEYLHVHFDSHISHGIEPHQNMKELCLMGKNLNSGGFANVMRMFDKIPYLTTLSIPTTDEFLQIVYMSCPNLKSLSIRGSFTDQGVTGIRYWDLDGFYRNFINTGYIVGEELIEDNGVRRLKSILDLKQLDTLSLSSESVGDRSVLWGILGCRKNLKKLDLAANVTDESLDALMDMKELRELTIPIPREGGISLRAMDKFTKEMIHVRLRFHRGQN